MPQARQSVQSISKDLDRLESLPQPVVAYGRDLARGDTLAFHSHRRAQLVYASDGIMTVTTRYAAYLVPPQRAVWMPAGVEHRIDACSDVNMRTLYIEPGISADLPIEVCVLNVAPLLRELIITAVILDQIRSQSVAALALPLPSDPRLRRVAQGLTDYPGDPRDLAAWASEVGASTRTLVRLFPVQTGMTFREWRQQCRLLHALELLASGASVTAVALETGYDNSSAFIAMFRRCLGTTPLRYVNDMARSH